MIKRQDLHIRDPFILVDEGRYYLYGTKGSTSFNPVFADEFPVYVSDDLETFSDPIPAFKRSEGFWSDRQFWAPEVHRYRGVYYMFATFCAEGKMRATQILKADNPLGPFLPHSEPITPGDWMCLDGTFYQDREGHPWLIFCHEWIQIHDGTICAIPLREDLTGPTGEAVTLFHGSEAKWAAPFDGNVVTDGPFLVDMPNRNLLMLWSTGGHNGYCIGAARSVSGNVLGPWVQEEYAIFDRDGGHGMLFTALEGETFICIHQPNEPGLERPVLLPVKITDKDIIPVGSIR